MLLSLLTQTELLLQGTLKTKRVYFLGRVHAHQRSKSNAFLLIFPSSYDGSNTCNAPFLQGELFTHSVVTWLVTVLC